jgi:hypothetical protein
MYKNDYTQPNVQFAVNMNADEESFSCWQWKYFLQT